MSQLKRYGKPQGAPGIVVYEQTGINQLSQPTYGTCAVVGQLKRGPMGTFVPIRSTREYMNLYGDPNDLLWHLYSNSEHLTPDFVDDYFNTSGGAGVLFVCRLDLDGTARKSALTLKSRAGADVLRITAANPGRWAGRANEITSSPVVVATTRTFTLVKPGTMANEFVDAIAEFTGAPGKQFKVLANTTAAGSGEVVFTVGAQHNLALEGVIGPTALTGTASYTTRTTLAGTISFPLYQAVTGTVQIANTVITGTGTTFGAELFVGSSVYLNGEARIVESITSDTTLTIDSVFSVTTSEPTTIQRDNLTVTGLGTAFTTALAPGVTIYVPINGQPQGRVIESIVSATSLRLRSGFTAAVPAATAAEIDNLTVLGTTTNFTTEISPGQFLIDPNRAGSTVRVVAVTSATELKVDKPFYRNFADAQLTRQAQQASIKLETSREEGVSIKVGHGRRKPDTHFSLIVFFNGVELFEVGDCSLDPSDTDFVENVVDEANLVYSFNAEDHHAWIQAESLWTSDYTTFRETDVRPVNGGGKVLELTNSRLYTVAEMEYAHLVGQELYPNPYEQARAYFRIQEAAAPKSLDGTISTLGTAVTGVGTTFTLDFKSGDFVHDPLSNSLRKVRLVTNDTSLLLETAFANNVPAGTKTKRAGYLQINQAYDLQTVATIGDYFTVSHTQPLTKGYDGNPAQMNPWYYQKFADPDLNYIERAVINRNVGLVRIFTPGISGIEIQKAFMNYAEQKSFEYRAEIPSYVRTSASAEAFVLQQLGRSDNISVAFPSYGEKSNPLGAGYRYTSLSGMIAGGESRRALANRGYHVPFAGLQAVLPNILRIPFNAEPSDEAVLNLAGIQPILSMDGRIVVFGARGPAQDETYTFLHISRLQRHYTRVFLEARNLMNMMFLPNQPGVSDQLLLIFEQFAQLEYAKGAFTQYLSFRQAVEISSSIESSAISDEQVQSSLIRILNGVLSVNFFFVPTGIVEVIEVYTGPNLLVRKFGQGTSKYISSAN